MRHLRASVIAAAVAVTCCRIAEAADLLTMAYKAPPPAAAAGNWYFWIDGAYDSLRLPRSALGIHNATSVDGADLGPNQSFDPRLSGGGVRGAFGYMLPGSDFRFEFGGSYVAAKGSGAQQMSAQSPGATLVLLNGTHPSSFNCVITTCAGNGTFNSSYTAWQFNGTVATDRKYGAVTVTPFLALFGGNSHDNQSFSQAFSQLSLGLTNTLSYAADVALSWTDIGARAGLDLSAPVSDGLTFNLGGWIGAASRYASLSGSDVDSLTVIAPPPFVSGSAVSANSNRGVWLANSEAGLSYTLTTAVTLRGFAGLNYDDAVPGLASPAYTGSLAATSPVPAGITYAHETSYYAGGGAMVKF